MGVKPETPLQASIKKLIKTRGGYAQKNHGDMISEPGIADITACYKGLYLAIEVKDGNNVPSPQQGIHCRNVLKADGISLVAWSVKEVELLLDEIDFILTRVEDDCNNDWSLYNIILECKKVVNDDGSKY